MSQNLKQNGTKLAWISQKVGNTINSRREFTVLINSDLFNNLLLLYSKFKGRAHAAQGDIAQC